MGAKLASLSGVLGATQDRGLSLIAVSSFSSAASVSVDNCFTSTYDDYRIEATLTSSTTTAIRYMRLRASGTDNSSSNYYWQGVQNAATTDGTIYNVRSVGLNTAFRVCYGGTFIVIGYDIKSPALTDYTFIDGAGTTSEGSELWTERISGRSSVTTSYDGFTLYPATGTITGTVRVYGLRNA